MNKKPKSRFFRRTKSTPLQGSRSSSKQPSLENFSQHGYYAFNLYFIDVTSISLPDTLKHISVFEKYIRNNEQEFSLTAIKESKAFFVDLQELEKNDKFLSGWKDFKSAIRDDTAYCLTCMGLAMHQTICNDLKSTDAETSCNNVPFINARIMNHPPLLQLKNIKINCYNTLVSLQGTVIKVSNVRLLCKYISFECSICSESQLVNQVDGNYTLPTKCPTKGCKAQANFVPSLTATTRTINWQTVKLQELVGIDPSENGRIPRTIECELSDDLVGCCIPGDDITVVGVIRVKNTDNTCRKLQPSIFSLYMDVVSVVNNKNKSDNITGTTERISFNTQDYYAIKQIHAEPNLFRFLVNSLCPNIYGHEVVKAGFTLALFEGTDGSQDDAFSTRAVSHVLMVGDPGLGKSQILQACANVAPRGVYVCGNTCTSSGLTVTLAKESGGDYTLEAGALILADQGHCCIDEFDKMTTQHAHLLETMEQQSISIAKAGVTCNLSACTSILAAANPSGGHYDKSKTVSENIKMSSPLISRFDLVFLLLDQPCTQYDGLLSEHILALHSGRSKKFSFDQPSPDAKKTLQGRLRLLPNETMDYLPHQLFRKYIAYAQKYVHPTVSLEAQEVLRKFYLELRKSCKLSNKCSPVTARQLESLLRLTQARAKVELREVATLEDAEDVISILQHSFISIFTDEFGALDLNRSKNSSGMSRQNEVKRLLAELQRRAENLTQSQFSLKEIKSAAEEVGIQQNKFFTTLQNLNLHGFLLKCSANKYRLTSVDF